MKPRRCIASRSVLTAGPLSLLVALASLSGCGVWRGVAGSPDTEPTATESAPAALSPLAEARSARQQSPAEPYWPYREAVLLAEADSLTLSEHCLRDAIALDPGYAPALTLLSKTLYDAGRHDEAITFLERARASGRPLAPELLEALALHYEAVGRVDEASAALDRATPIPPESSVPSYVRLQVDELAAAAAAAEAAVDADSKNAVHRNNLGIVRMREGDPEKAREEFQAANQLDPLLPGPLYNLALVERHYFTDVESARSWFARYWALSHDDPDSLRGDLFPGEPVPSIARSERP